ncbi:MAG: phenylalanine--tRNA ligase subunit beta [Cyanobium sp. PLM2.Bin73]|nr:MAG: phenylalanine--tRNA ligase subunit beta [Cyanobium sp. PLM2.Bin73]
MRVSHQWLCELVSTPDGQAELDLDIDTLAERLSIAGFEVEAVEDLAARAAGVVVGRVTSREPHPDATKLSVCRVDVGGEEQLQIVCGAANVRAGIHVPVALVGTTLPAVNLTIKPAELRGVASSGMICSLAELGFSDSSGGIAVLEDLLEAVPPVGTAVGPSLGLDDQLLELAITANRPDGLSMRGIAREVAALCAARTRFSSSAQACPDEPLQAESAAREAMEEGGLFSLTALGGIRVAPSPLWLQRRLEKAGIRPINNVVDITNLVMLETGQPLHAFDSDALAALPAGAGGQAQPGAIGLRQARPGEPFTSLDGEQRQLSADALVVTYADKAIALAGVIGGAGEAVHAGTSSIWLEAAVFPARRVRQSARSLGLRTEASSRFEKGLPCEATLEAADRACALLVELAGATVQGRWLHRRPQQAQEPLLLRRDALHNLLGPVLVEGEPSDLEDGRISATLEAIGCTLEASDEGWLVRVPPARALDLCREVDLIEEVARLVGYDQFAAHLPDPIEPGGLEPAQEAERRLRRALCAAGLQEACSFSLVAASDGRIPLANPLLADYGHLRDQLQEELLEAARRNLQSGQGGFWAFEIGQVFQQDGLEARSLLSGVICGERRAGRWRTSGKPALPDYYQARGVLQQALTALQLPVEDRPLEGHALLHPGRAAELVLEGRPSGCFGQLHPSRAELLNLPDSTHLFELDLAAVLTAATRRNRWQPAFSPFATVPAAERDLALVVPTGTRSAQLLQVIRKAGRPLLEQAELIDRYEGEPLASGQCSQAFRLRYRDPRRTLTEAEVESAHSLIRQALEKQLGAQLR